MSRISELIKRSLLSILDAILYSPSDEAYQRFIDDNIDEHFSNKKLKEEENSRPKEGEMKP